MDKYITLNELPNNVLDIYFENLNQKNPLKTDISDVIFPKTGELSIKTGPYLRLVYKKGDFFYKIFNFYESKHPHFIPSVCYDIIFPYAIKANFFDNITLVDSFIYDDINKRIIGYKYPILNPIKELDNNKYNDLLRRIIIQTKKTNVVYTDLVPHNIMEFEDKYYIIDLETVTSIEIYKNPNIRNKHFITNCKIYQRYII